MWTKRAAWLTVALFAAACGDGPSGPTITPGVYRLVSVNGQPLPWIGPPSMGFAEAIDHGDLHLRGDGTFGLGIGGSVGGFASGNYRALSNNQVRLTFTDASAVDTLIVGGDSAALTLTESGMVTITRRFVFKRAMTPQSVVRGVFALAAINGQGGAPLIESDTVINGIRFVARVHYDTLQFMDEVFYRRHRYQSNEAYNATGGEISFSSVEWTNFGAHDAIGGRVVLRGYSHPFPAHSRGDTLSIVGADLVRRSQLITGLREDRYVRQ